MNTQTFMIVCRAFDPNCEFINISEFGSSILYALSNKKLIPNVHGISADRLTEYIKSEINK